MPTAQKNKVDNGKKTSGKSGGPPAGFTKVSSAERYWWAPEKEGGEVNPCHGILMGRSERHDNDGYFYVVKLESPTAVRDSEKNERMAEPGEYIVVDERHQLQDLISYVDGKKLYSVYIDPKGKVDIGGNRQVWRFDVYAKQTNQDRPQLPAAFTGRQADAGDTPIS